MGFSISYERGGVPLHLKIFKILKSWITFLCKIIATGSTILSLNMWLYYMVCRTFFALWVQSNRCFAINGKNFNNSWIRSCTNYNCRDLHFSAVILRECSVVGVIMQRYFMLRINELLHLHKDHASIQVLQYLHFLILVHLYAFTLYIEANASQLSWSFTVSTWPHLSTLEICALQMETLLKAENMAHSRKNKTKT